MNNTDFLSDLLQPYKPQLALPELVEEVNKLYHTFEAEYYDSKHPEVYEQLPALWQEMVQQATKEHGTTVWRILDFGCGTGFEAEELLRILPPDSIAQLTCYDPCPDMLDRCRAKIAPLFPQAVFCSDREALAANTKTYNLLATNSLLHHLPDPVATIMRLLPLLGRDAVWLAGHEPSKRFYMNAECRKAYNDLLREHKWKRFLSPKKYLGRLKQNLGLVSVPARQTAKQAFRKGLFERKPTARAIALLVDFHVAHSIGEAKSGRGFDFGDLQQQFASSWKLIWVRTYSFMGPFYEGELPAKWAHTCRELARRFPQDGANFCAVWGQL